MLDGFEVEVPKKLETPVRVFKGKEKVVEVHRRPDSVLLICRNNVPEDFLGNMGTKAYEVPKELIHYLKDL